MADHSINHQSFQESIISDVEISPGHFVSRMRSSPTGEAVDELEKVIQEMKERHLDYDEFVSAICSDALCLRQPTIQERNANQDVLFGRTYRTSISDSILENQQERSLALAYLHTTVNTLSETDLFHNLPFTFRHRPPLSYNPGDGLDTTGSSAQVRGGGGIAGPTALDTVNLGKLLEECAAPPSPLSRLPSDNSTSGSGIPQSPTSVSTAQQSFLTTGSPESAGATDTTRI